MEHIGMIGYARQSDNKWHCPYPTAEGYRSKQFDTEDEANAFCLGFNEELLLYRTLHFCPERK